jgi:hypothetical protein
MTASSAAQPSRSPLSAESIRKTRVSAILIFGYASAALLSTLCLCRSNFTITMQQYASVFPDSARIKFVFSRFGGLKMRSE